MQTPRLTFRPMLWIGSLIVVVWTIFRHISNGVNFDIVGQIGVSDQWLRGLHDGAVFGQTNYLLKMPLYLLVNRLSALPPMYRLLLLALLCNVATFIGIAWLAHRLQRHRRLTETSWLPWALGWLAIISGSVYWLDYANSRNLETLGGVAVIYGAIAYLQRPQAHRLLWLTGLSSLVFFADNLQLYAVGGGLILYCLLPALRRHRQKLALLLAMLGAIITAKILSLLASWLLPVRFLQIGHAAHPFNLHTLSLGVHNLAISLITIFGANFWQTPLGPNSFRQLLNAAVLGMVVICIIGWRRASITDRQPGNILLTVIATNIAVYILSQQVLETNTARYLVMVPIMALLFVGLYGRQLIAYGRAQRSIEQAWLAAIMVSGLLIMGAFGHAWPLRHQHDQHIYQTVAFLRQHHYALALGSQETGITTTYFAQGSTTVLPVSCGDNRSLQAISLFYDHASFKLPIGNHDIPFILADHADPLTGFCDQTHVVALLGVPKQTQQVPGVGQVLIFDAATIRGHHAW